MNLDLKFVTCSIVFVLIMSSCGSSRFLKKETNKIYERNIKYRGFFSNLKVGESDCMPIDDFLNNEYEKKKEYVFTKESSYKINAKQRELDSLNVLHLMEISKKEGFPSKKKIGALKYNKLTTVIYHFDRLEHLVGDFLKDACLDKDLGAWDYAYFYDRSQLLQGKPCYYMAAPMICKEEVNMDSVNLARKEIGLSPIVAD